MSVMVLFLIEDPNLMQRMPDASVNLCSPFPTFQRKEPPVGMNIPIYEDFMRVSLSVMTVVVFISKSQNGYR